MWGWIVGGVGLGIRAARNFFLGSGLRFGN